jgi:hypothetical protein
MFNRALASVFVFRNSPETELDIDAVSVDPLDRYSLFNMKILKNDVRSEHDISESMYDSANPMSANSNNRTQNVSLLTRNRAYGEAELLGPQW